jgi:uncharacterized repeat protein (TIGR01451 family)
MSDKSSLEAILSRSREQDKLYDWLGTTESLEDALRLVPEEEVQANLIVRYKELKVGETVEVEIELINAGKKPALLIKVNEVIPRGFDLVQKSENCRVEDSYVNMKGRRLDPLKAEEVALTLKPRVQGRFALKPTVLYLDENGKCKSNEPEPVSITVKELGKKGWLKGEK